MEHTHVLQWVPSYLLVGLELLPGWELQTKQDFDRGTPADVTSAAVAMYPTGENARHADAAQLTQCVANELRCRITDVSLELWSVDVGYFDDGRREWTIEDGFDDPRLIWHEEPVFYVYTSRK
jgi:hypothetical protein